MEYRLETTQNATVVRLKGALDRSTRGVMEMEILSLPRQRLNLVIDLAEVSYISSAGLHLLLDLHRRCEQLDGRLLLTAPNEAVRDIFAITGFGSSGILIFNSLEEGLSALKTFRDKGNLRGDFDFEKAPAPPLPPTNGMDVGGESPSETEEVHFSAFYPQRAAVEEWHSLLVYTYIPALLTTVREDARKFRDEIGEMGESKPATSTRLARGTAITLLPDCEGVQFNPKSVTFQWLEDLHRVPFRLQAEAGMAGLAGNARVTVYAGPLIVATLKMGMLFTETEAGAGLAGSAETSARMYQQDDIFISYSHRDTEIVRLCEKAYKALGHNVLVDYETLRSGQDWNTELMRMIDRADIFQLFWSENASASEYCRQEWQYALRLNRGEGFIRPVYWQEPIPTPPDELRAIHFDFAPFAIGE